MGLLLSPQGLAKSYANDRCMGLESAQLLRSTAIAGCSDSAHVLRPTAIAGCIDSAHSLRPAAIAGCFDTVVVVMIIAHSVRQSHAA